MRVPATLHTAHDPDTASRLKTVTHSAALRALVIGSAVIVLASACSSSSSPTASSSSTTPAVTSPASTAASTPASTSAAPVTPVLAGLSTLTQIGSTVPANGDVNPYGIAAVTTSAGSLVAGDTLVSNFNSKANVQGTGTTIVEISPTGKTSVFAQISKLPAGQSCPGGIGLTTALAVLPGGYVIVGSLPALASGALPKVNPDGCLIVLNSAGTPVATWTNPNINGPWDLTTHTTATGVAVFVANALSRPATPGQLVTPPKGVCTVVRLDVTLPASGTPVLAGQTVIGSGYPWRLNKAALVQGPTGLAIGSSGTLYVAETVGNTINAIPNALTRTTPEAFGTDTTTSGGTLNGPLGLTLAPNGDLIAVNGNDGNAIEITPAGTQIKTVTVIKNGAGDLFGVIPDPSGSGLLLVNDGTNALDRFHS
jgi:hypothetical protein